MSDIPALPDSLPEDLTHIREKLMRGIAGFGIVSVARFDRSEAAVMLWAIKALAEAHEALRPFAASAEGYDGDLWNETEDIGDSAFTTLIKVADLRRARDILIQKG